MAAVSSFKIKCTGIDCNYDINTMVSVPDDLMLTMSYEVVEQATLSDTRVKFIYGDTAGATCMVAKGIAITPDGLIMMGKDGYNAVANTTTSNYPDSGDTTSGLPIFAKIGDTVYKSVPDGSSHAYSDALTIFAFGCEFTMSPVL